MLKIKGGGLRLEIWNRPVLENGGEDWKQNDWIIWLNERQGAWISQLVLDWDHRQEAQSWCVSERSQSWSCRKGEKPANIPKDKKSMTAKSFCLKTIDVKFLKINMMNCLRLKNGLKKKAGNRSRPLLFYLWKIMPFGHRHRYRIDGRQSANTWSNCWFPLRTEPIRHNDGIWAPALFSGHYRCSWNTAFYLLRIDSWKHSHTS